MKPTNLLHPELDALVEALGVPTTSSERVAVMRNTATLRSPPSDRLASTDHLVPGEPPVPVRVHRPKGDDAVLPCVISIHGGGYVAGSYDMDDARIGPLCLAVGMVAVSIDYRLAPESPYPAAMEDCYRSLLWTFEHADQLGIDRSRIGVNGRSAGGGLAAAVALAARDRGEVEIAFQLLECPMIDDRQLTYSSQVDGLPIWSRESNAFGWSSYLGELNGTDSVPYTAAPARAGDLSGLPPTLINVGTLDGFLDENVDYALRLNRAGVACELHVYPGGCHGYQLATDAEITTQSNRDVIEWLRRITRNSPS